jgi:serine/threonine protein kinase
MKCLKADDYKIAVSEKLVGIDLELGYKIVKVIGAGNVGTTVLVQDIQVGGTVVLKIYHSKGSVTQGL